MRKYLSFIMLGLLVVLVACGNRPQKLTQSFNAYGEVSFKLPEDWRADPTRDVSQVSGGYGFMSEDYAGLTYLRLHKGAVFAVLGDWDMSQDASTILQTAFADHISVAEPIKVLGHDGTYAHGTLEQGQGVGAVHVVYDQEDGTPRQWAFIATVADDWQHFEPTFLKIIASLTLLD